MIPTVKPVLRNLHTKLMQRCFVFFFHSSTSVSLPSFPWCDPCRLAFSLLVSLLSRSTFHVPRSTKRTKFSREGGSEDHDEEGDGDVGPEAAGAAAAKPKGKRKTSSSTPTEDKKLARKRGKGEKAATSTTETESESGSEPKPKPEAKRKAKAKKATIKGGKFKGWTCGRCGSFLRGLNGAA